MSRRRRQNDGPADVFFDMLFEAIMLLPWWLNFGLAVFSYFALHYLSNKYPLGSLEGIGIIMSLVSLFGQYLLPFIFVMAAIAAFWHDFRGKELLWSTGSKGVTQSLSKMSWRDFEILIGAWFKSQGYDVIQAGGSHADGGVDIELRKDGELFLVQCKHYRAWKVPVHTVRDLYGVMTSRGAAGGFVVTSGHFTSAAEEFAEGRVITLLDGDSLSEKLDLSDVSTVKTNQEGPRCPHCGEGMIRRTARHGEMAGHDFWGCSKFPHCRGIIPISS